MTFTRTSLGLSNMSLFYSVDLIIFIEGGAKTFSEDEILGGASNAAPADLKFWHLVLKKNNFAKKYELKAIGSKTAVLAIASRIIAGEVSNVATAMDRDLDEYFGRWLRSPLVLYTDGYSWENDVYTKEATRSQVKNLLMDTLSREAEKEIHVAYETFEKAGRRLVRTELIFRSQGIAWISEARGEKFFSVSEGGILNRKNVQHHILSRKGALTRPAQCPQNCGRPTDPYKDNCGKLLRALSVAVTRYICKKYGNIKSLDNNTIAALMLDAFGNTNSHVRSRYYQDVVARLSTAVG